MDPYHRCTSLELGEGAFSMSRALLVLVHCICLVLCSDTSEVHLPDEVTLEWLWGKLFVSLLTEPQSYTYVPN